MRIAALNKSLLILLLVLAGCRTPRRDLVEAELRTKDRLLRESQAEVERTRMVNDALERDFVQRQQGLPPRDNAGLASPKDITLGSGTGGVDSDKQPGADALLLVVVPRDEDGHPVRAVGVLSAAAWEILPGGVKVPLCTWEINATDLRRTWKSGLLGSGIEPVVHRKQPFCSALAGKV